MEMELRPAAGASGGIREGVPHQGVAPGGAGPVEAEDVEAAGGEVDAADGQVEGRGAGDAAALGRADGGHGRAEGGGGAGRDLHATEGAAAVASAHVALGRVAAD